MKKNVSCAHTKPEYGCDHCKEIFMHLMSNTKSIKFIETDAEVRWFEEEIAPQYNNMEIPDVLQSAWSTVVCGYLRHEFRKGINEFRIAINDDETFIIHPLGKDGETLDWSLR